MLLFPELLGPSNTRGAFRGNSNSTGSLMDLKLVTVNLEIRPTVPVLLRNCVSFPIEKRSVLDLRSKASSTRRRVRHPPLVNGGAGSTLHVARLRTAPGFQASQSFGSPTSLAARPRARRSASEYECYKRQVAWTGGR